MMHPELNRVVAVLGGGGQGSGYLLASDLILTSAHVVGEATRVEAIVRGQQEPVSCRVVWRGDAVGNDAALLLPSFPLSSSASGIGPDWCWTDAPALRAGAVAIGFPQLEQGRTGFLESYQVHGLLNSGTGGLGGYAVLELDSAPEKPGLFGASPWAGLSGAAVFIGGRLAGVIRADRTGWAHSQLEVVPAAALVWDPDFGDACQRIGVHLRATQLTAESISDAHDLEQKLRTHTVRQFGKLQIIGASLNQNWPLDTSYLSLELRQERPSAPERDKDLPEPPGLPLRAEEALGTRRRVLLHGPAGAGKSTLLQWLAVHTAKRRLPDQLSEWSDSVPLLLRLRSLTDTKDLPGPGAFLEAVAKPLSGHPAVPGWVDRQLNAGRLLLLIDGVDEVSEEDRPRVRAWLEELVTTFPDNRYVVTTRPSAVKEGWLASLGFVEFEIQPMGRTDVAAFIATWHRAVSAGCEPEEQERLRRWQEELQTSVLAKPDLGRLATNPLLCALICALNRDRQGYLPSRRMELYAAALEMLMHRRDRERGITPADGVELSEAHQRRLMQKLAYWLATNSALEMSTERAEAIIADALPTLRKAKGSPKQVLQHLLLRSGLIRQPSPSSVDFVHRTFQDHLAAEAALEGGNIGVLVRNATDDQWGDVLRMAVALARPSECEEILEGLLDAAGQDDKHRDRLSIVAATCLDYASDLDPALELRIQAAVERLIPPPDDDTVQALAQVGPPVLDLLPPPEGLTDDEQKRVVRTAELVGDNRAIPLLARYATAGGSLVRLMLPRLWGTFDARAFATYVLAPLADREMTLSVESPEQLACLSELPGSHVVYLLGGFAAEALDRVEWKASRAVIVGSHGFGIGGFLASDQLRNLSVDGCMGVDFSALAGASLSSLGLSECADPVGVDAIGQMKALQTFTYGSTDSLGIQLPAGLRNLTVEGISWPTGVEDAQQLETLGVQSISFTTRRREAVSRLPRLRHLMVDSEDLGRLEYCPPFESLSSLTLVDPSSLTRLRQVARCYPRLSSLLITFSQISEPEFDLRDLSALHGCRVRLRLRMRRGATPPAGLTLLSETGGLGSVRGIECEARIP